MRRFGRAQPTPNMNKSKFTETQIVSILKEAGAGLKVSEVCRKHGISQH
jgi:putative transposase